MADTSKIVLVLIGVTIAGTLFVPFQNVVSDNTGTQTVTNESVTVDANTWQDLDGYDVDESSVTVYNSSGGTVDAANYDIREPEGQINFTDPSSSDYDDGETVEVTYDYQATSGSTTTVVTLVPLFVALLILGILAAKVQEMM